MSVLASLDNTLLSHLILRGYKVKSLLDRIIERLRGVCKPKSVNWVLNCQDGTLTLKQGNAVVKLSREEFLQMCQLKAWLK